MKKARAILAVLIVCLLLTVCYADWPEGLSPAKPYAGVREQDLSKTIGYIMLYPRAKLPAKNFCDVLQIYLPREDVEANEGYLHLYDAEDNEVYRANFADAEEVIVRSLTEDELQGLMWGGGICLEVRLPVSLKLEESYYVLLDEGCFTAGDGKLASLAVTAHDAWTPIVKGDFGISGLYYTRQGEADEEPLVVTAPQEGDEIHFDLILGGEAVSAVIYSENDSVEFEEPEYLESATLTGKVTKTPLRWGVVFLNAAGDVLDQESLSR